MSTSRLRLRRAGRRRLHCMGKRIYGQEEPLQVISLKEAKEQGRKYYHTGKPCPKGHLAWRLVSSYVCTECRRQINAGWYEKEKDYYAEASKRHFQENREYHRTRRREYYLEHRERILAQAKDYRETEEGAAYTRAQAVLKNAARKQATPPWSDLSAIESIYRKARRLEKSTGLTLRVDHYYPIKGKTVCGLHVPENLRIITKEENHAKLNKHPENWEREKEERHLSYPSFELPKKRRK